MGAHEMIAGFQHQPQDSVATIERSQSDRQYARRSERAEYGSFSDTVRDVRSRDAQQRDIQKRHDSSSADMRRQQQTRIDKKSDAQKSHSPTHTDRATASDAPTTIGDDFDTVNHGVDGIDDADGVDGVDSAVPVLDINHLADAATLGALQVPALAVSAEELAARGLDPALAALSLAADPALASVTALADGAGDAAISAQRAAAAATQTNAATAVAGAAATADASALNAPASAALSPTLSAALSSPAAPSAQQAATGATDLSATPAATQQQTVTNSTPQQNTSDEDGSNDSPPQGSAQTQQTGAAHSGSSSASSGSVALNGFSAVADTTISAPVVKTAPAAPTPAQPETNAMDKAVAKQVDRALIQNLGNNQRFMQLRLTPPELGTVRIEIFESNGRMSVRLHAEDDSVRASLERSLPQMRQDIRGGDTPISAIDMSDTSFLMDRDNGNPYHSAPQNKQRAEGAAAFSLEGDDTAEDSPQAAATDLGITVDNAGVHGLI